jgi:hypothetical protein
MMSIIAASDKHGHILFVDKLDCVIGIRVSIEDGVQKRMNPLLGRMALRFLDKLAAVAM